MHVSSLNLEDNISVVNVKQFYESKERAECVFIIDSLRRISNESLKC